MKVLFVLVDPVDHHLFDSDSLWDQIEQILDSSAEAMQFERLGNSTLQDFATALTNNDWDVLHFVTEIQEHGETYSNIALLSSDGHLRYHRAEHLAAEIATVSSLKLVVLQVVGEQANEPTKIPQTLVNAGVGTIIYAPLLRGGAELSFIGQLYGGVLAGLSLKDLAGKLEGASNSPIQIRGKVLDHPLLVKPNKLPDDETQGADLPVKSKISVGPPTDHSSVSDQQFSDMEAEFEKRRNEKEFDVFLCHNSKDKPLVTTIAHELKRACVLPWLDVWEVSAGYFQEQLEEGIASCKIAVVCIGPFPIDRWQKAELQIILDAHVNGRMTVIPIWLPNVPKGKEPKISALLAQLNWVDFREDAAPPIESLIRDIKKKLRAISSAETKLGSEG